MSVNLEQLSQLLGPKGILLDDDVKARPNPAWGKGSGPARAIIRPNSTEALADAIAICYDAHQAMVPPGGVTCLVKGITCSEQNIAISLDRMNGIESLDTEAGIMVVNAGTRMQVVQDAASENWWLFPVDLEAPGDRDDRWPDLNQCWRKQCHPLRYDAQPNSRN